VSSTRAIQVVAKAHFESKQYSEAAILRKDYQATQKSDALGRALTEDEYDDTVWNSSGVQNRLMREDYIRYSPNYYDKKNGTTSRNLWARRFSKLSHALHGLCEMNAAPTGMSTTSFATPARVALMKKAPKTKFSCLVCWGLLVWPLPNY